MKAVIECEEGRLWEFINTDEPCYDADCHDTKFCRMFCSSKGVDHALCHVLAGGNDIKKGVFKEVK